MLAKLEKACVDKGVIKNENPDSSNEFLSQFDLICGVSTGSIVAFMTSVAGVSEIFIWSAFLEKIRVCFL